jgi:sarcosine oxidase
MRSYLRDRIPQLGGTLVEAKTCMYTNTPDHHFITSLHPQYPQVAIAAGFSGHGFKFASVVGEILADLASEGSTKHPIALFDPKRLRE